VVAVGSDGYKQNIKIINNRDNIVKNFYHEDGKFTQVLFVKPPSGKISGFVTGNTKGNL
jgi:hypothetical protein